VRVGQEVASGRLIVPKELKHNHPRIMTRKKKWGKVCEVLRNRWWIWLIHRAMHGSRRDSWEQGSTSCESSEVRVKAFECSEGKWKVENFRACTKVNDNIFNSSSSGPQATLNFKSLSMWIFQ
jgi:hypothetical protein